MVVLQRILWPSSKEENAAGQPLSLAAFTPPTNRSILFHPTRA